MRGEVGGSREGRKGRPRKEGQRVWRLRWSVGEYSVEAYGWETIDPQCSQPRQGDCSLGEVHAQDLRTALSSPPMNLV